MLPRIDRYLIREVLLTFAATVVVLLAMVLTHRLANYLNQAAAGVLAQESILKLLGLQAIRFLVVLMPVGLLLAIMLTLGRLYRDNEITAMTACGVGPGSIYRPLFLLTVPMAAALTALSLVVVPLSMELQDEVQARARQDAQISVFSPGTFREVLGGEHVIYVGEIGEDKKELRAIFIQSRIPNGVAITTAQSGHQEFDSRSGARFLVLNDGYRYEGNPGLGNYRGVRFQRLAVRVDTVPMEEKRQKKETVPTIELLASDDPSDRSELQGRLSGPISLFLIAFIAPLLARTNPREGRYGRVVAGVLIYTIYMNLLEMSRAWLERGGFLSELGVWWVHGLLAAVGLAMWYYCYGAGLRGASTWRGSDRKP